MTGTLDIQPAIDAIAGSGDLVATRGLSEDRNLFDAEGSNGLFDGDVPSGVTLRGERAFLVQGSLLGDSGGPCRIAGRGDVVITGQVAHAHIRGDNIHIAGEVQHAQLEATGDICLGAGLTHSHLIAGQYEDTRHRIEELRREVVQATEERDSLLRQVAQDEKRIDKSSRTTRTPLDLSVGRIVQHEKGKVRIDLSSFYESVGQSSENMIDLALNALFARGIVGVLSRANRRYITENPAREKVFLQLLRSLRELFMLVARRDQTSRQIGSRQEEIDGLVRELAPEDRRITVLGELVPDVRLEFLLPQVERMEDGDVSFIHQLASAQLQAGPDPGKRTVLLKDTRGTQTTQKLPDGQARGLSFRPEGGGLAWDSLLERDPAA